ncbi:MAG: hypothetical protein JWO45_1147 [Spartobacteria bacterium]|nr:hypothetical protein [Spartobacteria bacterium]
MPPWLVVLAARAAIYLPALGSYEIKGEEGRRILPAVAMLDRGDYVVPRVGGETYFSKPPLVNWVVAASFRVFGKRNEWTARAPSVLCILAVAMAFVFVAAPSLGRRGSIIAALIWLTTFGVIEKGRLIEIEALYVSLCALAMICWLSWWQQRRTPWLTWIVPWIFLGLGWLAKGPILLFFFYALVFAVLWQTKRWKDFFHPAHFIGVSLMLAIFAAWAIPFAHLSGQSRALNKWSSQFTGRVSARSFSIHVWFLTIVRTLGQFLPWVIFLPALRLRKLPEKQREIATALLWSAALPLIVIGVMPATAPRYLLPVVTPFCWLVAMAFAEDALARPGWLAQPGQSLWSRVGAVLAAIIVVGSLAFYPIAAIAARHREKVRPVAAKINAVVAPSETIYAVDPNYQPFFFYTRAHLVYLDSFEDIPVKAGYFLIRPDREERAVTSERWSPRHAHPKLRVTDYRKETVILFVIE